MSNTKEYLESSAGADNYSGKNIKLPNNDKFFITDNGYYKPYQMMRYTIKQLERMVVQKVEIVEVNVQILFKT